MRMKMLVGSVLVSAVAVSCSSSGSLCGAGTRADGPACVVDLSLVCGAGTQAMNGACVALPAGLGCGPGTTRVGDLCVVESMDAGAGRDGGTPSCPMTDAGCTCPVVDAGVCPAVDAGSCPFRPERGVPYCRSSLDCSISQSCRDRGDGVEVCMGDGTTGDYCRSSLDCASSRSCRPWAGLSVCVGNGGLNAPCASSLDCTSSLFCRDVGNGVKLCR
jgi:hypothetical protein